MNPEKLKNIFRYATIAVVVASSLWIIVRFSVGTTLLMELVMVSFIVLLPLALLVANLFITHPTSLVISMLGFKDYGKTVYLTVLFNKLTVNQFQHIAFSQYGSETIERITDNLNTLSRREWLPPTIAGEIFPFRANAHLRKGLTRRAYKIEIGDFAGEHMGEFDTANERYLHKTKYFKYVVQSDAIFAVVDMSRIIKGSRSKAEAIQNSFKSALQMLFLEKGVPTDKKMSAPVALILTKTDLCGFEMAVDIFKTKMPELVSLCQKRCENFEIFPVSSVGEVGSRGQPPGRLNPYGVIEPLIWILEKM